MPPNEISAVENALDVEINENDRGLYELFLDYDAGRYSEAAMEHFAKTYDKILRAMKNLDTRTDEILRG